MTNLVTGIIGILLVLSFFGIMLAWVPAVPLIVIVALVMGLLIVDFLQSLQSNDSAGQ